MLVIISLADAFIKRITFTFCWGSIIVIDILDEDTSHQSEGMRQQNHLRNQRKKRRITSIGGVEFGKKPEVDLQTAPGSTLSPMRDITVFGASPTPLVALDIYLLEWTLTHGSLLMRHVFVYEWSRHTFSPSIIDAWDLLSNSHMTSNLHYVVS